MPEGPLAHQLPESEKSAIRVITEVLDSRSDVLVGYLFGSRARGSAGVGSDYDVGVLFRESGSNPDRDEALAHRLREALDGGVHVVSLGSAPIELAYAVIAEGVDVFCRSEAERVEYEAKVLAKYGDLLPFLRAQSREIREGDEHEARVYRYRAALGRTLRALGETGAPRRPWFM